MTNHRLSCLPKAFRTLVGMMRLERTTSRPPDVYSNQLSYIPCWCKWKRRLQEPGVSVLRVQRYAPFAEIPNFREAFLRQSAKKGDFGLVDGGFDFLG